MSVQTSAIVVAFCLGMSPAVPQQAIDPSDRCDRLSWSVAREQTWFHDPRLPRRRSGARLRRINRAVELELAPTPNVTFFMPPAHTPAPDSFSGELALFGVPRPGLYQITLSDLASIDVFENGVRLKPVGETQQADCVGAVKSARFELAPGALILIEVTNANGRSLKAAVAQAL